MGILKEYNARRERGRRRGKVKDRAKIEDSDNLSTGYQNSREMAGGAGDRRNGQRFDNLSHKVHGHAEGVFTQGEGEIGLNDEAAAHDEVIRPAAASVLLRSQGVPWSGQHRALGP